MDMSDDCACRLAPCSRVQCCSPRQWLPALAVCMWGCITCQAQQPKQACQDAVLGACTVTYLVGSLAPQLAWLVALVAALAQLAHCGLVSCKPPALALLAGVVSVALQLASPNAALQGGLVGGQEVGRGQHV
jgi:hypothetical protein